MSSLNETPKGSRVHIGIFGRRNAGKSSLINRLTKQSIALVSEVAGTTTDPVFKAMELLPVGPVMLVDTAGIDDVGDLGKLRIAKTRQVMGQIDIALLVIDATGEYSEFEATLLKELHALGVETIVVLNKADIAANIEIKATEIKNRANEPVYIVSAEKDTGFDDLRARIVELAPRAFDDAPLLRDLLRPGDTVVFCVPIDTAAPKGRLILPQVQAIRDTLDAGANALVVKENQLSGQLANLKNPPSLVVTDSQVFKAANEMTPPNIPLTSFSILMARKKGDLSALVDGAKAIERLKPGDKVLIAEACTHQCQAEDIGRVKIPNWLQKYVGGKLDFDWYTGDSFPEEVSQYKLVIHCGACMINRRAMLWRQRKCLASGVPMVNYGVLIAKLHGILPRVLSPLNKS